MNLADAIRKAAHSGGNGAGTDEPFAGLTDQPSPDTLINWHAPTTGARPEEETEHDHWAEETAHPGNVSLLGGGMVRLELFLAPEQLHRLIRSVVATQHSVMTLREAAGFLRTPTAKLEQMATAREVPAFQVDGKWRFSRARLAEWLTNGHSPQEQVS